MEVIEHTFEELSALKYRIYTTTLPNLSQIEVLIVAFEGEYGYGCKGNSDATYINAIIVASATAWEHSCFILDYRNMKYEWGDKLPVETGRGRLTDDEERVLRIFNALPNHSATLISKRNRRGIRSLTPSSAKKWLFESLEDALAAFESAWHQFYREASEPE